MRKLAAFLFAVSALGLTCAHAQSRDAIDILDPSANALISSEAKVETVYFARILQDHFYEGPVWHKNGNFLTVSDIPGNEIDKLENGKLTSYVTDVFKGKDTSSVVIDTEPSGLHYIHLGPNGASLDPQGRLVYCGFGSGEILRREPDGKITVLADSYQGHHLNAPDDLVVKSDGAIYFTEFRGGLMTTDRNPQKGAPGPAVYMLKDGKLTVVVNDLGLPNGLAFSPDEKILYVDDSHAKKIMRYDVNADGTLANGKIFIDMNGDKYMGGASAAKVDTKGNVWDLGPGGVWVMTPEGKHVATIRTLRLTNLAFGDPDAKTLYMTGPGYILRVRTKIAGILP